MKYKVSLKSRIVGALGFLPCLVLVLYAISRIFSIILPIAGIGVGVAGMIFFGLIFAGLKDDLDELFGGEDPL